MCLGKERWEPARKAGGGGAETGLGRCWRGPEGGEGWRGLRGRAARVGARGFEAAAGSQATANGNRGGAARRWDAHLSPGACGRPRRCGGGRSGRTAREGGTRVCHCLQHMCSPHPGAGPKAGQLACAAHRILNLALADVRGQLPDVHALGHVVGPGRGAGRRQVRGEESGRGWGSMCDPVQVLVRHRKALWTCTRGPAARWGRVGNNLPGCAGPCPSFWARGPHRRGRAAAAAASSRQGMAWGSAWARPVICVKSAVGSPKETGS